MSRFRLLRLYQVLWYKLCVNQLFYLFIWELINYGHEHCLHNKEIVNSSYLDWTWHWATSHIWLTIRKDKAILVKKKTQNLKFKTQIVPIPLSDINTLTSIMYEQYHNTCKIIRVFYNTCIPLFKIACNNYMNTINVK